MIDMNYLDTKYDYGVVLEDNAVDRTLMGALDALNDKLTFDVFVNLFDGDDHQVDGYVEMTKRMAFNDGDKVLADVKKVCDELGYTDVEFDKDLNVFCGDYSQVMYGVKFSY